METLIAVLLLLVGLAIGTGAAWLLRGRELAAERGRARQAEAGQAALMSALQQEQIARVAAETRAESAKNAHDKEVADLAALRDDIEAKLKALAADALRDSNQSFLSLAGEVFAKHRQAAETILGEKEKAIQGLLAPVSASLEEHRKGLSEIEKAREAAYGGLRTQLIDVSRETRQLTTALRSAPQTRGRWGELQLKNVIELAGMTA